MPDQLSSKDLVTFKEVFMSNVYEQEALNLLERKGIITKAEVLEVKRGQVCF